MSHRMAPLNHASIYSLFTSHSRPSGTISLLYLILCSWADRQTDQLIPPGSFPPPPPPPTLLHIWLLISSCSFFISLSLSLFRVYTLFLSADSVSLPCQLALFKESVLRDLVTKFSQRIDSARVPGLSDANMKRWTLY